MKKLVSLILALCIMLMVGAAFAADPSTPSITIDPVDPDSVKDVAIDYIAYRILEADIDKDPTVNADGTNNAQGEVAYYVTTQARVDELTETNLFNITRVGETNKWYVELKDKNTTADALVEAFSAESFDLSVFPTKTFSKATGDDKALSGTVDPGYYYITSTLGSKIALQTLTAVEINEKNEYTTDDKIIPDEDKNAEIGKIITYKLEVTVPVTANKQIVLTDTMSKGLTYKGVKSQKVGDDAFEGTVAYNSTPAADGSTSFTITYTAQQIAGLVAGKTAAQKIVVEVDVMVNAEAAIETDIPNTLDLDYGNVYKAVPDEEKTKTYKVKFDKVDDDKNQLTGAEFKLTKESTNTKDSTDGWIGLVAITAGQKYRLATADDAAADIIDTIVTDGHTVEIDGLDLDLDYFLVETKAPTGYNILTEHVELEKDTTKFIDLSIENKKGTELPSTGGIGTTIFYVLGGLLVVGAAVILIARRKADEK